MTFSLSKDEQKILLDLVEKSIEHGLATATRLEVDSAQYPQDLQAILSCFVTLHYQQQLRGCIGGLEARYPLVVDVVNHAYAAAFQDPRFPPLSRQEFESIEVEISVLSPQEVIHCESEIDLVEQLRPGIDGLVIRDGVHQSTFLPSVWQQIPDRQEFLHQLKSKAGLSSNYWSPNFKAFRYTTFSFSS